MPENDNPRVDPLLSTAQEETGIRTCTYQQIWEQSHAGEEGMCIRASQPPAFKPFLGLREGAHTMKKGRDLGTQHAKGETEASHDSMPQAFSNHISKVHHINPRDLESTG